MQLKHYFQKKLFSKISIFQNFIFRKFCLILVDFILFLFNLINFFFQKLFCNEQCSFSDSGTVLSQTEPKTGRVHQVHSPGQPARPGRA